MFNIWNFYEITQTIENQIQDMFCDFYKLVWKEDSKFIKRLKQGIVFYKKPVNDFLTAYKNPRYDRRITSMRVFTHTKK
jgi:hypothetical protein